MAARMRRVVAEQAAEMAEQGMARRELRPLAGPMAAVDLPRVEAQRVARAAEGNEAAVRVAAGGQIFSNW
jgi:hypothetical protein